MHHPPSLLNCPSEVMLLIANLLSQNDLAHLAQTNSSLYNIAIPVLWACLSFKPSSTQTSSRSSTSNTRYTATPSAYRISTHDSGSTTSFSTATSDSSLNLYTDDDDDNDYDDDTVYSSFSAISSTSSSSTSASSPLSCPPPLSPTKWNIHHLPTPTTISNPPPNPQYSHSPYSLSSFSSPLSSTVALLTPNIDPLAKVFIQGTLSSLAKASIKTIELSLDCRLGDSDCCYISWAAGDDAEAESQAESQAQGQTQTQAEANAEEKEQQHQQQQQHETTDAQAKVEPQPPQLEQLGQVEQLGAYSPTADVANVNANANTNTTETNANSVLILALSFSDFLKQFIFSTSSDTVPNLQQIRVTCDSENVNANNTAAAATPVAHDLAFDSFKNYGNDNLNFQESLGGEKERVAQIGAVIGQFLDYRNLRSQHLQQQQEQQKHQYLFQHQYQPYFQSQHKHNIRLTIDSASLFPVQAILESSSTAHLCLERLHVEVLQSANEHHVLSRLLSRPFPRLEYLAVVTQEGRFEDVNFNFNEEDDDDEDDDDEDDDGEEILYQVDQSLLKTAFENMPDLKTLILKSTSLIEALSSVVVALPAKLGHLELESNYNNTNNMAASGMAATMSMLHMVPASSASSSVSVYNSHDNSTTHFNNLWSSLMFFNGLSQLTTLNVDLSNSDLFACLPHPHHQQYDQQAFLLSSSSHPQPQQPQHPFFLIPPSFAGGNLRDLSIEGDYVLPAGFDSLIFSSNRHLERVKMPYISAAGAHSLAQNCMELRDLTVFGLAQTSPSFVPGIDIDNTDNGDDLVTSQTGTSSLPQMSLPQMSLPQLSVSQVSLSQQQYQEPDFLDYRLLPVLAQCRKLQSLYIHVAARSLHGFDVLHLLLALSTMGSSTDDANTNTKMTTPLTTPPPLSITIEQTDASLPYNTTVISEGEVDEYGGFGMLPLNLMRDRLSAYTALRTEFKPVEGDLSGISEFLVAIDGDERTFGEEQYEQYYGTLANVRTNCIFRLDCEGFVGRNSFLL